MAAQKNQKSKKSDEIKRPAPVSSSQSGAMKKSQVKGAIETTASVSKKNRESGVVVKEPLGHYYKNAPNTLTTVSFDWNDDYRGLDLVSVIRNGIDYKLFRTVTENLPLNDKDWAVVLDTTIRTLERYKKDNKTFASKQTETIIEIKQLMQLGEEVFGDVNNFHTWLMMENVALGGVIPKSLLDTSVGLGIVRDELGRIDHGIFA